jgi:hypothetical protein
MRNLWENEASYSNKICGGEGVYDFGIHYYKSGSVKWEEVGATRTETKTQK